MLNLEKIKRRLNSDTLDYLAKAVLLPPAPQDQKLRLINKILSLIEMLSFTRNFETLTDSVHADAELRWCLLIIVKLSSLTAEIAKISSVAITILNKAKVSFSGLNFQKIHIPYALLNGGRFYNADFSHADLTGVIARQAVFDDSNFSHAILNDFSFGEEPIFYAGPDEPLNAICFNSTGELLVACSGRGHIHIWDFNSGDKIYTLEGTRGGVSGGSWVGDWVKIICFSSDNRLLASAGGFPGVGGDTGIRVWDLASGAVKKTFNHHSLLVEGLCFHTDGRLLASCGNDKLVCIVDIVSEKIVVQLKGHTENVHCVIFSYDGRYLLSGSSDGTVRVWDVTSYRNIYIFREDTKGRVVSIAFSMQGKFFASTSESRINLWDFYKRQLLETIETSKEAKDVLGSIHFSPDDRFIVCSSMTGKIHLWSTLEKTLYFQFATESSPCTAIRFHPQKFSENKYLITGGLLSGIIKSWTIDVENHPKDFIAPGHSREINSLSYSVLNNMLISGGNDGVIFWGLRDYSVVHRLETDVFNVSVMSVCVHPILNLVAIGTEPGYGKPSSLWMCDVENNFLLHKIDSPHYLMIKNIAFSFDGNLFASGSGDRGESIGLWHVVDCSLILILRLSISSNSGCYSVCFSKDNTRLVGGSTQGEICIWNIENILDITELYRFKDHEQSVVGVVFSANGLWFASGSWDQTVNLYAVASWTKRHKITQHTGRVENVSFNASSTLLAVGSSGQVFVWDLVNQKEACVILGHANKVLGLAFIDNYHLATGCWDRAVRVWSLRVDAEKIRAVLHWISHATESGLKKIDITDAVGLSRKNRKLLEQFGAVDKTHEMHQMMRAILQQHVPVKKEVSQHFSNHIECHLLPSIPIEVGDPRSYQVLYMACSHDGVWLALALMIPGGGAVWLYNPETEEKFLLQKEGMKEVYSVAFALAGQHLASGEKGGNVCVWDITSKRCMQLFLGHKDDVYGVAFHPKYPWLASSSEDSTVRLWNINDATLISVFRQKHGLFWSMVFNPQGKFLVVIDRNVIHLLDVNTFQAIHIFEDPMQDRVICLAFHPNGKWLVSGPGNVNRNKKNVRLWDIEQKKLLAQFEGPTQIVRRVAFDSDGKWLAAGSYDNSIYLWDVNSRALLQSFKFGSDTRGLFFHPQHGYVAAVGDDNIIRRWHIEPSIKSAKAESASSDKFFGSGFKIGFMTNTKNPENKLLASDANKEKKLRNAANRGEHIILQALLESGAEVNSPSPSTGQTALHYAVIGKHRQCIVILMNHGANPNINDNSGKTVLLLAEEMQDNNIKTILSKNGLAATL